MEPDPIVGELWEIKDRLACEASYAPHRFLANLRRWETEHAYLVPVAHPPDELGRSACYVRVSRPEHPD